MTTAALTSSEILRRIDHALERLANQTKPSVPSLRYSIQHGGNENFPWWVVARFVNGADESKVVDVSIDCQVTAQGWDIRADIARESGSVLQELPAIELSMPKNGADQMEAAVERVEGFLLKQDGRIARELI